MNQLTADLASFEALKRTNEHAAEYWSARDLSPLLGYSQCRRFEDAIRRAMVSCAESGNETGHHFAGAGKMVEFGSGSAREVRAAIEKIGGTMPEDIPADEHIKSVEKRLKATTPKLALDGGDAAGLLGGNRSDV